MAPPKKDKLKFDLDNIAKLEARYLFGRRLVAERLAMNRSLVNITSTEQERFHQYSHNAYRGSVDWTDNNRFAIIPPWVNLEIFDKCSRTGQEESIQESIFHKLSRDISPERIKFPCIVASSRLDPKKNHLGLVEAFACNPGLRQKANPVILTGSLKDPLNGFSDAGETESAVLESLLKVVNSRNLRGQVSMFFIQGQGQLGAAYRYFVG